MNILRTIEAHSAGRTIQHDGSPLELGKAVNRIVFSADGAHLLTGSEDFTAALWKSDTGERVALLNVEGVHDVKALAISPDGRHAVTGHGSWGGARLWDLPTGAHVRELVSEMYIDAVAFSADSAKIFVSKGGQLWEIETATGTIVRKPKSDGKKAICAFDPKGETMIVARGNAANVHAVPSGKKKKALPAHAKDVKAVAWSVDGSLVATCDDTEVRVIDCATGEIVATRTVVDDFDDRIKSVAVCGTREAPVLATGHGRGTVRLWIGAEPQTSEVGKPLPCEVAFDPSGTILAVGAHDGVVTLFEAK